MVQVYYLYIEQVAQTVMTGHNRYKVMPNELEPKTDPSQPVVYQIRIKGHLGSQWTDWFEGLTITLEDNGDTLLTGPVVDSLAVVLTSLPFPENIAQKTGPELCQRQVFR